MGNVKADADAPGGKHRLVLRRLQQGVRDGEFQTGKCLPGERALAERYGVSYMTARRAIKALEADGLCMRRGTRTWLTANAVELSTAVRLRLLFPYLNSFSEPLLIAAEAAAQARGWITQWTFIHGPDDPMAVSAVCSGDPCLILLPSSALLSGALGRSLTTPRGPRVMIGNSMESEHLSWIKADDRAGMRLAISHLEQLGHRNILFVHDDIEHQGLIEILAEWKKRPCPAGYTEVLPPLCIRTKRHVSRPKEARAAIVHHLRRNLHVTAIICDNDELAVGVLHGLRDLGLDVPADVSLVSFGNTVLAEYCVPSLSVVDVQFRRHVTLAAEIVDAALAGKASVGGGQVIRPRFVARESTAPPPHRAKG